MFPAPVLRPSLGVVYSLSGEYQQLTESRREVVRKDAAPTASLS
jgi:hypothetical protein